VHQSSLRALFPCWTGGSEQPCGRPPVVAAASTHRTGLLLRLHREERLRREEVGWFFDPYLVWDRPHGFLERRDRFLGRKDVNDAETVLPLTGDMHQESSKREIRRRLDPRLPVGESANNLLVSLLGKTRNLMDPMISTGET
jgi:hypothetical protein